MRAEATKKKGQKETWTGSERYKKIERRRERERERERELKGSDSFSG